MGVSEMSTAELDVTLGFGGIGHGLEVMGVDVNDPTIPERISPEPYGGNAAVEKYDASCGFIAEVI